MDADPAPSARLRDILLVRGRLWWVAPLLLVLLPLALALFLILNTPEVSAFEYRIG